MNVSLKLKVDRSAKSDGLGVKLVTPSEMLPSATAERKELLNVLCTLQPSKRELNLPLDVPRAPAPVQVRSTVTSKQLGCGGGCFPSNSQTLTTALRLAESRLPRIWNWSWVSSA